MFIEAVVGWGAFAYVGADLNLRFGLSFTAVGLIVGSFAIGGLIYAGSVQQLVNRFGQPGLAIGGGMLLRHRLSGARRRARPGGSRRSRCRAIGLGFYALHNTLQTNATQMTPQARGTAVAIFSSAIYLGQTVGVAARARSVSTASAPCRCSSLTAVVLPALAWWFARELRRRP